MSRRSGAFAPALALLSATLAASISGCGAPSTSAQQSSEPAPDLAAASGACDSDRDCPANLFCDREAHACVACVRDGDCAADSVCHGHACVRGCSAERGCGDGGVCEADAGACLECARDADCRDGARPYCASGRCGACLPAFADRADTCGAGRYCAPQAGALTCVPGCSSGADCLARGDGGVGATPYCDPGTHQCVACAADDHCPAGQICKGGACVDGCSDKRPCGGALSCCGGTCSDVRGDAQNCGACGAACPGGWNCCASTCVNPAGDLANCGGCGIACAAPHGKPACAARACAIASCDPGWDDCNGVARDGCETHTDDNEFNCGGCGNPCHVPHAQPACVSGACAVETCLYPFADCNGQVQDGCETNTRGDVKNCGDCGVVCAAAHATPGCVNGACTLAACDPGFGDCNGVARDGCEAPLDGLKNCGACGVVCGSVNGKAACVKGACQIACNPGFGDCDGDPSNGCETGLLADAGNCGACGNVCSGAHAKESCAGGVCGITACDFGWADCDRKPANGCETDLLVDAGDCGQCGAACSNNHVANPVCGVGLCSGACDAGFADCNGNKQVDGCETGIDHDLSNCGACGAVCPAVANGAPGCAAGVCGIAACNAGFADCDHAAGNGCEVSVRDDVNNCGACGNVCPQNNRCIAGVCNASNCINNAQWMRVQCTWASWEWSSDRNFRSPAAANAAHTLQTGCAHVGIQNVAQGLCSIDGGGWISTQTFTMSGCNTNWEHIAAQGDVGNCGGHDGDTYRHLVIGDNDCYAY